MREGAGKTAMFVEEYKITAEEGHGEQCDAERCGDQFLGVLEESDLIYRLFLLFSVSHPMQYIYEKFSK
jgi:hypothetical protein